MLIEKWVEPYLEVETRDFLFFVCFEDDIVIACFCADENDLVERKMVMYKRDVTSVEEIVISLSRSGGLDQVLK